MVENWFPVEGGGYNAKDIFTPSMQEENIEYEHGSEDRTDG